MKNLWKYLEISDYVRIFADRYTSKYDVEPFKTADAYGLRENCPRFLFVCIFKQITIIT